MPLIIALIPFLKKYATEILIAWVVLAALWYVYHSGYTKRVDEQKAEIATAEKIAIQKTIEAKDELQKIADSYIDDIGFGMQSSPAGMPAIARNPTGDKESGGCQRIAIPADYKQKIALIHALDLIIKADRKLVNGIY